MKQGSGKPPSIQFYWGDPLRHAGLMSCSLDAKGLFHLLFCLMAGSDERGVLLINGAPISLQQLARIVGEPQKKVERLLSELLAAGVFARRDDGTIWSPRMVNDERVRRARAEGGHKCLENDVIKARMKGPDKGTLPDTLEPSQRVPSLIPFELPPSSSSASSSASANSGKEREAREFLAWFARKYRRHQDVPYSEKPQDVTRILSLLGSYTVTNLRAMALTMMENGVDEFIDRSDRSIAVLQQKAERLALSSYTGQLPAVEEQEETA